MTATVVGAVVVCERCGEENPSRARFCLACGVGLEIAEAGHEERKLISVLFVDLEGFTASSDRADPEDVRDILERYHRVAKERIEQFGGIVEKFIGDAVMAVFGAPVAYGDDAERAVRAGLSVLEALDPDRDGSLGLAARAAVNTGDAVVRVGDSTTGEAIAMGDVVNSAARLQSAAPRGRLIVGGDTYLATRHAMRYEVQAPVDAKGKAEPLDSWLVVEAVAAPSDRPVSQVAFTGRDNELEVLRSLWRQAVEQRRPHVVTVLGSPGIGKSRLCGEVSRFVAESGGRILRGRCLPYAEQAGYHAFRQLVRGLAGIYDSDPPQTAREKLADAVEAFLPGTQSAEIVRDVALLLGLGVETAVSEQRLLFFSARRLLEELGREQPTLVVFEDIHWAGTSELDLVEYLGGHLQDTAVLTIALSRPDLLDTRPWGAGMRGQTTITLEPLEPSAATRMAAELLPNGLDATAVERLVALGEGNPLFLEELAAAHTELRPDELPVTVRAVIASRVDALPHDARELLLGASVIGRTFWRNVLQAVSGSNDLDRLLDDLEQRGFIRREPISRLEGDTEYRLRHALIRDVAYATLPRATRRQRHRAVAEFISERVRGDDSVAWILAHHWRLAGDVERALPALLAAARVAERAWAADEALDLYSQALELAADNETRLSVRLGRGMTLVRLGSDDEAAAELTEIAPHLDGAELLECLLYAGRAWLWSEQNVEALDFGERALALAGEVGDESATIAAEALISQALAARGGDGDIARALELGESALAGWQQGVREYELADHLHLMADVTYWVGDYERCTQLGRAARLRGHEVQSTEATLRGGGLEAMSLIGLGRHEEALEMLEAQKVVARELGHVGSYLDNYSSMIFRELLDLDEARRRSERALASSHDSAFSMPRRFATADLLLTSLLAGDVEDAAASWPALWADASNATAWSAWLIRGRLAVAGAEIALRQQNLAAAAESGHIAVELAKRTLRRKYESRARSILGEALVGLGRVEDGLREARGAVAIADSLVNPPGRWEARAALARSLERSRDASGAECAYAEAAAIARAFAATLAAERGQALLNAPQLRTILDSGRT